MNKVYRLFALVLVCMLLVSGEIIREDRCNMNKEIRGRLNSKYSFKDGKCERYYFFEFRPSSSYFDTKEECISECMS